MPYTVICHLRLMLKHYKENLKLMCRTHWGQLEVSIATFKTLRVDYSKVQHCDVKEIFHVQISARQPIILHTTPTQVATAPAAIQNIQ